MWTDFLFFLEVTRRRIARFFARGGLSRRFSGLPMAPDAGPHKPGLLLIQIDGLSRRQFERALANNKLPFLKSLIERDDYALSTFYSGLPSTTPAVQAELHYGVKCAVPAFGYLDRGRHEFVLMKDIEQARKVEADLLKTGGLPLLQGGSSWMNVYSGGAAFDETHFSSVTFSAADMLRPRSFLRAILIAVLHLPATLRAVALTLAELVLGIWDMARAILAGDSFAKELEFILSRVIVGAAIREVLVLGGTIDLNRGLPVIHVNFLGYDERSHRRGPSTKFAHAELRRIDAAIRKLHRAAVLSQARDYDVWIFSDHGHENARSYEQGVEGGVGQTVYDALVRFKESSPWKGKIFCGTEWARAWYGKKRIRKHLEDQEQPDNAEPWEKNGFAVLARGPVAHLYLATSLSVEDKRRLAQFLVSGGKIPGVAFCTGSGAARWIYARGEVSLPQGAAAFFKHPGTLREEVGRDLVCLCEHPDAGDLLLFGWDSEAQPWTFPAERGAHAGPGLDETQGFCLIPANTPFPSGTTEFIRPRHLREAALHALGRSALKRPLPTRGLAPRPLRVITYNVHSCVGLDGRLSCSRIIRAIRAFDPDILALQEVDIRRKRSRGENQVERIAGELQMHHAFCSTVQSGLEHYGHALLSKFPLELVSCGRLLKSTGQRTEPRGALLARIQPEAGTVWILNTHLGLSRAERERQIEELLGQEWLGRIPEGEPVIVCGDFNMVPRSAAYRRMASALRDSQSLSGLARPLPTFVSTYPITRIDYIFVSDHIKVDSIRAPRNRITVVASDHLPLIADLRVGRAAQRQLKEAQDTARAEETGFIV